MNKSFIKNILISGWVILATTWVAVFAQTAIETNVYNAVQTIMRTIYTDDGSAGGNTLVDINNNDGHIYIDQSVLAAPTSSNLYLWLNSNNEVTVMSGWGWTVTLSGEQDHDWYQVGTTQAPMNINDNIYTLWSAGVQTDNPNANLQVVGNITFGDINNFAGYPNDNMFNSVLWWIWNHIETERSSIAGWYNNNIIADADRSFIGWWGFNNVHARASTIWWGEYNTINSGYATAYGTIAGGRNNTVMGETSTIGGWGYNIISKSFSVIGWGFQNEINGNYGSIWGGINNDTNWRWSSIAWWNLNSIDGNLWFIGWWKENRIYEDNSVIWWWIANLIWDMSTAWFIWGWEKNIIDLWAYSSILAWRENIININNWPNSHNTILNWYWNKILYGSYNTIANGGDNTIKAWTYNYIVWFSNRVDHYQWYSAWAFIYWWGNHSSWGNSIIMGNHNSVIWQVNIIWSNESTGFNDPNGSFDRWSANIIWWIRNTASWANTYAMGIFSKALHKNTFIRNDWYDRDNSGRYNDRETTTPNTFLIRAFNGVGINTNDTSAATLTVDGTIKWAFVSPTDQPGITQTINLTNAQWVPCTMTIEAGIITNTTCQ